MALKRHCHYHHHHHHRSSLSFATITAITFLLLSTVSALRLSPPPQPQVSIAMKEQINQGGGGEGEIMKGILSRRRLNGPGSSPPTCRSKCGRCAPCKPVHVPIQPGLSIPLEYYPEAWRCKCGNKLFMP